MTRINENCLNDLKHTIDRKYISDISIYQKKLNFMNLNEKKKICSFFFDKFEELNLPTFIYNEIVNNQVMMIQIQNSSNSGKDFEISLTRNISLHIHIFKLFLILIIYDHDQFFKNELKSIYSEVLFQTYKKMYCEYKKFLISKRNLID